MDVRHLRRISPAHRFAVLQSRMQLHRAMDVARASRVEFDKDALRCDAVDGEATDVT